MKNVATSFSCMPRIASSQDHTVLSLEIYSQFVSECVELLSQSKCEASEKDNTATKKVHQQLICNCPEVAFFYCLESFLREITQPKSQIAKLLTLLCLSC